MPQQIVIVQVFVAKRDTEHTLHDQCLNRVFNQLRRTSVVEEAGKPLTQTDCPISLSVPASEVIVPPSDDATT